MKPFHFQQFSVLQSKEVFRVGTDAVLLSAMSSVRDSHNILEVGTGSGIISLMLAQRNTGARITAIDIDPKAADLASLNFENSDFANRITAACIDFNNFKSMEKFDLIVCNPPFFEINTQSEKDVVARQKIHLNFLELITNASMHLHPGGILSVIIPLEMAAEFENLATNLSLHLTKKVIIYGRKGMSAKRVILEFNTEKTPTEISEFFIEISPRVFSQEYLDLTKEFHVFGNAEKQ